MKKNMSSVDRVVRALFAVVVAVLLLTGVLQGALGVVLGIVAVVLFVTALVGTCPLYLLLGLSTLKK